MNIFGSTDKGLLRSDNQDSFGYHVFSDNAAFAVVCDGMGGANAGNVASKTAVESICRYIKNSFSPNLSSNALEHLLRSAVISANLAVYNTAKNDVSLKGMGTTVVLVFILNSVVYVLHVGDSRLYSFKDDTLVQLTVDHSMVQSLVDNGQITADEAKVHPKKNIITRALGVNDTVAVDLDIFDYDDRAVLLLCSDGLTNYVGDDQIKKELSVIDDTVCIRLINDANANGGGDNITAVVFTEDVKGEAENG